MIRTTLLSIAVLISGCAVLSSKEATIGCQAADVVTTKIGLAHGAVEANPVARALMGQGFLVFAAIKLGIGYALTSDSVPDSARIGANVVTCGVAAHNVLVMK